MKIQLETITPDSKSPFRLLHDPKLNHLFYWHFHPELEVLHIKPTFKENTLDALPELKQIDRLLELSKYGIAFYGETKKEIGSLLKTLHLLEPFAFFMQVITILKKLSESKEFELLHTKPFVNKYSKKEQKRLRKIYALIDERYHEKITLTEIAGVCNLSKEAFCRYFKKTTGSTFISFLNQYRISQAKRLLLSGKNVSETCYGCGFESLSYFNRSFKKLTGENPSTFKKKLVSAK